MSVTYDSSADSTTAPATRAVRIRARQRAKWFRRAFLILILSVIPLILMVTWNRDQSNITANLEDLQPLADALQQAVQSTQRLPAYPKLPSNTQYIGYGERFYAARADHPVVIAFRPSRVPIELYLLEDGRSTLILDEGQITVRWYGESEFQEMLREQEERIRAFEDKLLQQRNAP